MATDWTRENCAVGNTLAVVGERWTLLVLRECFLGVRRFEQIQRNTVVARNILTGAEHGGGKAMELTHKHCGATVMPHLACPECGERVAARDMRAAPREALRETA